MKIQGILILVALFCFGTIATRYIIKVAYNEREENIAKHNKERAKCLAKACPAPFTPYYGWIDYRGYTCICEVKPK